QLCSVDLSIQIPRNDSRLGKFRRKSNQLNRLHLPLGAGCTRPLKVGGEKADVLPVDIKSSLSDRHLVAHEILLSAYDGPLRQDHHSFGATCIFRYVVAVPSDPG